MTAGEDFSLDPKRATLSRELSEFLIELSIALHKHAMYPSDHPSLAPAAAGVVRRAEQLFTTRSSISLGVARSQLVIEGVATDSRHPVLADLANRLHKHHLGAVTFSRGIDADEVVDLLHTLAVETERDGAQPLGLGPPERLRVWKNARLHPLAYERLELLEEDAGPQTETEAEADVASGRRVRGAQLWIGLARAALTGQVKEEDHSAAQPAVVAKAIDEHPSSAAYDQVIVGYLLQIAEELRAAGGEGAVELRRRTSILLRELNPETLKRLVNMGGDAVQRRKFILDAADGLSVEAVVEIMKAAAEASQQQISHSLVRLLSKLAAHAERGALNGRPIADRGLRDQVRRLLADWHLRDPNPGAYGAALDRIAKARPLFISPAEAQTRDDERLVQISLEVGQSGPRVKKAVQKMVAEKRYAPLLHYLERFPPSPARDDLHSTVATRAVLADVLIAEPFDVVMLDRFIALMGAEAAEPMVEALVEAESRSVRRHLINRLLSLGNAIVPVIMTRLDDERWYVTRNLLSLIAELPEMPFGFSAGHYATHADARVRRQAIKMQLTVPAERESALTSALSDEDEEIIRLGLLGLERQVPLSLEPRIQQMAGDANESSELRDLAIRALAYSHSRTSRDLLVSMVDGGRTLLGKGKLAAKSTEMLAALRALAIGWHSDDVVNEILARAEGSNDPVVRAAVSVPRES